MQPCRFRHSYTEVLKYYIGVAVLAVVIVAVPSVVLAAWSDFLPKIYDYGADFKMGSSYESADNKTNGKGSSWNDTFIKEVLEMRVVGYSYDPKFAQFRLSVTGGLKQENFNVSYFAPSQRTGWRTGTAKGYDFTLFILPDHPYNLRLYSYHSEPLFKTQFAIEIPQSQDGKGAVLRYKRKPFFFSSSYNTITSQSGSTTSDEDSVAASLTYLKDFSYDKNLLLSGLYDHSNFSDSTGLTGNKSDYLLSGGLTYGIATLSLGATRTDYHQENFTGVSDNTGDGLRGSVAAALPLNFNTAVSYTYTKNTSNTAAQNYSLVNDVSTTSKGLAFSITHRLYRSLYSNYIFQKTKVTSESFGESDTTSHNLTFSYNKVIPWGALVAGLNLAKSTQDSKGATSVLDEPHQGVAVPGPPMVLTQQGIDPASIVVYADPYPATPIHQRIFLDPSYYIVNTLLSPIEITIITLPPPFIIPGTYTFYITYSLTPADFKVDEKTIGYNVSLTLLNGQLNPYYSYSRTTSDVVSGEFPEGEPLTSTNHNVGIVYNREPFKVLTEYSTIDSNLNSSRTWRSQASYSKAVTDTVRVYTSVTYSTTSFPQGESTQSGQGYSQQSGNITANIMKRFRNQNLTVTGGGSYSYVTAGPTRSTAYSVNSTLAWRVGKIFLTLGGNLLFANSEGQQSLKTESFHQYYYLTLRRKLL